MIKQWFGKAIFRAAGWTYSVNPVAVSDDKNVIIGFPHTSNLDGILAMGLFNILDLPYHILVKKELFVFPLNRLLSAFGCIPVDRKSTHNVVEQMVDAFATQPRFTLVVAPEATRARQGEPRTLRTGFWHIAKAANVPIVLMRVDLAEKHGCIFDKIYPTNDMQADLATIVAAYAKHGINVPLPLLKP